MSRIFTKANPLVIVIEAEPAARQAHNAFVPNGWKRAIVTKKSKDTIYQNLVNTAAAAQCRAQGLEFPLDGYIQMEVDFVRTAPAGAGAKPFKITKDQRDILNNGDWIGDNQKKDFDNYCKDLDDGLEGVAFTNDCRIQHAVPAKWLGRKPVTYVRLWSLEDRPTKINPLRVPKI